MSCCWICENCLGNQIVSADIKTCLNCTLGSWPNVYRNGLTKYNFDLLYLIAECLLIPHETIEWSGMGPIVALVFATLGILTTILTIIIFLKHNSTPVVKSTTRELSYIILLGIIFCYAITFAVLAKPSGISCFISRVIPPISFSIVYSALLTKTNRIARILAGSKKRILTKKPRFLSTFSQVSHLPES